MKNSHDFSTRKQLDEYLKCLSNLKVGDQIQFFVRNGYPSRIPTHAVDTAEIIGVVPAPDTFYPSWWYDNMRFEPANHIFIASPSPIFIGYEQLGSSFKPILDVMRQLNPIKFATFQTFTRINSGILIKSVIKTK